MPLAAGERLGPYEILDPVGAGGMGEVYKARDTRLDRLVAIKVSNERFSDRFKLEAKAVAALNHPNICTLHDVGPNYLVMEYIEGESPKGPLPLDEALRIARQIADALEAAHDAGITHRDLKPANIRIKPDGTVKVLDFGLAKVTLGTSASGEHSPTFAATGITEIGMILGTAAYMAPEQARGKAIDRRADIFAFGVVLYELTTGKRLFDGEDVGEMLARVIRDEPDLSACSPRLCAKIRANVCAISAMSGGFWTHRRRLQSPLPQPLPENNRATRTGSGPRSRLWSCWSCWQPASRSCCIGAKNRPRPTPCGSRFFRRPKPL